MKRVVGRKDVANIEDALLRLDMLTKEESLMMVVKNLEITCHVDGVLNDVNDNVTATKLLTEDIDVNVKATKVLTENIDHNVKAAKTQIDGIDSNMKATKVLVDDIDEHVHNIVNGTQQFTSVFRARTDPFSHRLNIVTHEVKRLSPPNSNCWPSGMTHAYRDPDARESSVMALHSGSFHQS
jgi:hypothetical protein